MPGWNEATPPRLWTGRFSKLINTFRRISQFSERFRKLQKKTLCMIFALKEGI